MEINFINGNNLYLIEKQIENKDYSITYSSKDTAEKYNSILEQYINNIFLNIIPIYNNKDNNNKLFYANRCSENAELICNNKNNIINVSDNIEYKFGKIIIHDWINEKTENYEKKLEKIEETYGDHNLIINATHHEMPYIQLNINNNIFHITIETTIKNPYNLQFCIGNTIDDFKNILKIRYLCNDILFTYECNKAWYEVVYNGGKKTHRNKKHRNKKHRNKTRKNKKHKKTRKNKKHKKKHKK